VSPEAQAVLALGRLGPPAQELPALDDVDGWKAYVAETDGFVRSMVGDGLADFDGTIEERVVGACPVYVVTPESVTDDDRRVYLDIHGGAWVMGGGDLCKRTAVVAASQVAARVLVGRLPDAAGPSVSDPARRLRRGVTSALLEERRADEIIVGGVSAGWESGCRVDPAGSR